jgi:hypothetical protein
VIDLIASPSDHPVADSHFAAALADCGSVGGLSSWLLSIAGINPRSLAETNIDFPARRYSKGKIPVLICSYSAFLDFPVACDVISIETHNLGTTIKNFLLSRAGYLRRSSAVNDKPAITSLPSNI